MNNDNTLDAIKQGIRTSLIKNNADVHALMGLGMICACQGETGEAEQYYRQALAIDPNDVHINRLLGILLFEQEDRKAESEAYFLKTLELDSDQPEICGLLGRVYEQLGDKTQAEHYLQRCDAYITKALGIEDNEDK